MKSKDILTNNSSQLDEAPNWDRRPRPLEGGGSSGGGGGYSGGPNPFSGWFSRGKTTQQAQPSTTPQSARELAPELLRTPAQVKPSKSKGPEEPIVKRDAPPELTRTSPEVSRVPAAQRKADADAAAKKAKDADKGPVEKTRLKTDSDLPIIGKTSTQPRQLSPQEKAEQLLKGQGFKQEPGSVSGFKSRSTDGKKEKQAKTEPAKEEPPKPEVRSTLDGQPLRTLDGKPIPPGYKYNFKTGEYEPPPKASFIRDLLAAPGGIKRALTPDPKDRKALYGSVGLHAALLAALANMDSEQKQSGAEKSQLAKQGDADKPITPSFTREPGSKTASDAPATASADTKATPKTSADASSSSSSAADSEPSNVPNIELPKVDLPPGVYGLQLGQDYKYVPEYPGDTRMGTGIIVQDPDRKKDEKSLPAVTVTEPKAEPKKARKAEPKKAEPEVEPPKPEAEKPAEKPAEKQAEKPAEKPEPKAEPKAEPKPEEPESENNILKRLLKLFDIPSQSKAEPKDEPKAEPKDEPKSTPITDPKDKKDQADAKQGDIEKRGDAEANYPKFDQGEKVELPKDTEVKGSDTRTRKTDSPVDKGPTTTGTDNKTNYVPPEPKTTYDPSRDRASEIQRRNELRQQRPKSYDADLETLPSMEPVNESLDHILALANITKKEIVESTMNLDMRKMLQLMTEASKMADIKGTKHTGSYGKEFDTDEEGNDKAKAKPVEKKKRGGQETEANIDSKKWQGANAAASVVSKGKPSGSGKGTKHTISDKKPKSAPADEEAWLRKEEEREKAAKKAAKSKNLKDWVEYTEQALNESIDTQTIIEGMDPKQKERLKDLISDFQNATDPNRLDYDDEAESILGTIRSLFGDKIANQVEAGEEKMHFGRPDHDYGSYDDLKHKFKARITKAGKMHKQDIETRKDDIKQKFNLEEKAVSKSQQKFMGMVHAAQKGKKPASKEVAKVAKTMGKKDAKDFASTKHKGLPEKVKEELKGGQKNLDKNSNGKLDSEDFKMLRSGKKKVKEGVNFAEMMKETQMTIEEMLEGLQQEIAEFKATGHMGEKLRDALDIHRHSNKDKLMGEMSMMAQPMVEEPVEESPFTYAAREAKKDGESSFKLGGETFPVTESEGVEESFPAYAKGNEKFGKNGMAKLRNAAQDGASEREMKQIRDKHNKYKMKEDGPGSAQLYGDGDSDFNPVRSLKQLANKGIDAWNKHELEKQSRWDSIKWPDGSGGKPGSAGYIPGTLPRFDVDKDEPKGEKGKFQELPKTDFKMKPEPLPDIFDREKPYRDEKTGKMVYPPKGLSISEPYGKEAMKKKSVKESLEFSLWDSQLEKMLNESLTVTTTQGDHGQDDSVSITASGEKASEIMALLRNAGLDSMSPNSSPEVSDVEPEQMLSAYGVPMSDDSKESSSGNDDIMSLMKKLSGLATGDMGDSEEVHVIDLDSEHDEDSDDYKDEDMNEGSPEDDANSKEWEAGEGDESEDEEEVDESYGQADEGNAFTGKLAKTQQGGEFELDGKKYKDTSSLEEGEGMCQECGMNEGDCGHGDMNEGVKAMGMITPTDDGEEWQAAPGYRVKSTFTPGQDKPEKSFVKDTERRNVDTSRAPDQSRLPLTPNSDQDRVSGPRHLSTGERTGTENYDDEKEIYEELANGADDTTMQDIKYLIKTLAGGLNKEKRDQTTLPYTAVKVTESREMINEWKKLSGIK